MRYIKQKKKWAEYVGINFNLVKFEETISEVELLKQINDFNNDTNIS
ncbi:hypothetical protein HOF65_02095 [bacterium]|nr:hypothetical protein [bacterium]MBT3852797.1 hypothetical protein [bacterium]MBT4632609.1 hypothetical protein [bacterium]MBT5492007.1 hypothetical protein [bacterium]MBT6779468.1 hypothetical protein [bacterium]